MVEKVRITCRAVKTDAAIERLPLQQNKGKSTPKPTSASDYEPYVYIGTVSA